MQMPACTPTKPNIKGVVATSNRNPPLALTPSCKLLILKCERSLGATQFVWGQLEKTSKYATELYMKSMT
jgi:hypothetical protein